MRRSTTLKAVGATALAALVTLSLAGHVSAERISRPGDELKKHLIARWNFNEAGGDVARDVSGNGHDGELVARSSSGALPQRVEAMVGKAMRFNEKDRTMVVVENSERLNPTQGLTLAAWIKHEGPWHHTIEIISKKAREERSVDGYRFFITRMGRLYLAVGNGQTTPWVYTPILAVVSDRTVHVAVTFESGRVRFYKNGRLWVDKKMDAQRILPNETPLTIGQVAGLDQNFHFNGLIDEVHIFNKALSAEQIAQVVVHGVGE